MAIAGRVAIVPKGDWSADATYKRLDAVTYNNTLYFAKKEVPAGTATSNTEYWSKSIVGGASAIATTEDAGIVKPADGLSIAEDGTLKVSIDGTTLTMDQVNNVIKLADTLKEKINGAFPAANLINNLTTTEAGFGLDARQGKALDDKITEINGSLNNKADGQYFSHDTINTWMQTPLHNGIQVSRTYAAFSDFLGAFLGTMLVDGTGVVSDFVIASSQHGFVPTVVEATDDLNNTLGNRLIEVVGGAKNTPHNGANFYGFNISWIGNNDFAFQLLVAPNEEQISGSTTPRMYMRSKNAGTWTKWNVIKGTLLS
jgi:hypothetical protein